MSLNESIVEDAAIEWFGALGYAVGHGAAFAGLRRAKPSLDPGEPAAERDSFSEVVQFRFASTLIPAFSQREKEEDRDAIRRLNPAIPEEASACALHGDRLATIRPYRIVRLERRLNP